MAMADSLETNRNIPETMAVSILIYPSKPIPELDIQIKENELWEKTLGQSNFSISKRPLLPALLKTGMTLGSVAILMFGKTSDKG